MKFFRPRVYIGLFLATVWGPDIWQIYSSGVGKLTRSSREINETLAKEYTDNISKAIAPLHSSLLMPRTEGTLESTKKIMSAQARAHTEWMGDGSVFRYFYSLGYIKIPLMSYALALNGGYTIGFKNSCVAIGMGAGGEQDMEKVVRSAIQWNFRSLEEKKSVPLFTMDPTLNKIIVDTHEAFHCIDNKIKGKIVVSENIQEAVDERVADVGAILWLSASKNESITREDLKSFFQSWRDARTLLFKDTSHDVTDALDLTLEFVSKNPLPEASPENVEKFIGYARQIARQSLGTEEAYKMQAELISKTSFYSSPSDDEIELLNKTPLESINRLIKTADAYTKYTGGIAPIDPYLRKAAQNRPAVN